ncbi:MAG: tetratricopeptide repeat protein [candidate division Zixibacteria bacterium]|nr:tetratricopeptide repeat protein [candidate division Zixibacteria bacterium]
MTLHIKSLLLPCLLTLTTFSQPSYAQLGRQPRSFDSREQARERVALELYTRATFLERDSKLKQARQVLDSALVLDSDSYEIRMLLVEIHRRLDSPEDALDHARLLDPIDARAALQLFEIYRAIGENDSALTYLTVMVDLDSTDIRSRKYLARYYERAGQRDSVVHYRGQVVDLTLEFRDYNELGVALFQTGEYEDALEVFRKSIGRESSKINLTGYFGALDILESLEDTLGQGKLLSQMVGVAPENVPVRNRIVDYYVQRNHFDSAVESARMSVQLSPRNHNAIRRLGIIAYHADSLELSKEQFNLLLSISDINQTNYFYLGRIFLAEENFEYARINFEKMTVLADTLVDGWLALALSYREMDSLVAEMKVYSNALEKVSSGEDSVRIYFSKGASLERKGKYDSSVVAFEEALKLDSNSAASLNYLGYMLIEKNERLQYAKALVIRALEIDPGNGAYVDSYAWALYQEGNYQEALDSLRRAIEIVGEDATILDHVGDSFEKLGKIDSARVYWREALQLDSANTKIREKLGE